MAENDVPEGMDVAIFNQGKLDGERHKDAGTQMDNPFQDGTPQAGSWAAGYAAGNPPEPPTRSARKANDD